MADDHPEPHPDAAELYRQDFYAWTQLQADALRALSPRSNSVDWERLIEEVEGLGSSEWNGVKGHLLQIAAQLYKLRNSRARPPRPKWRAEVRQHRLSIEDRITPTIRRGMEDELDRLHRRAAREAQRSIDDYERKVQVDAAVRWTLPELLGESDDPLDGLAD